MKRFGIHIAARLILTTLVLLFALGGNSMARDYETDLSWFVDMGQFNASAHNDLFCLDCHSSVADQKRHPDPDNVRADVSDFFDRSTCGSSDCHQDILQDYEKGIHGRIHFENREKYSACIDCHDPHRAQLSQGRTKKSTKPSIEVLCDSKNTGNKSSACRSNEECLACHSLPAKPVEASHREVALCFHCHGQSGGISNSGAYSHIPKIDETAYHDTVHAENRCSDCHAKSITYGHEKTTRACSNCHAPHHEGEIHDAHVGVECRACHLEGSAVLDQKSGQIVWKRPAERPGLVTIHRLVDTESEKSCVRCHHEGNEFGAASMALPAKGVFCIACHTATFSVSDTTTLLTLVVSFFIFLGLLSLWLSAGPQPGGEAAQPARAGGRLKAVFGIVFSRRFFTIIKAVLLDAIIQRRLFRQSPFRWFSHGLIFYSFLVRFTWGLLSLILSLAAPEWPLTEALLDKNQPWVAFIFDLTGVLIILGVLLMVARKLAERKRRWPGMPRQEWLSMALIGGIIVVGFVLEGMRISMTLSTADTHFAFLGYAISLLFSGAKGLTEIYGCVWYLHAILTAAFIIWLPFSRMFHIVMGPVAVVINAAVKRDHD